MRDPTVADRLRRNTQQLVHTIDFYPTIKGAFWGNFDYLAQAQHGCITGVDLTAVDIPEDRAVLSWNYRSSQIVRKQPAEFWAISTKKLALYHRKAKSIHPKLKQGKNDYYVLEFGECEASTDAETLCMHIPTKEDLEYFRGVIGWIKNTPLLGEGVKTSELVKMFAQKVNYDETGANAVVQDLEGATAEDSPQDSVGLDSQGPGDMTAANSVQEQLGATALEPSPKESSATSKGFFTSVVHSFQDKLSTTTVPNDPSCDDILLFMPEILANLEVQLNSYLRASLIAIYTGKALLVLDSPQDVLCPADNTEDFPLGLSRILYVPEVLTRGCPLPCQGTRGYADWNGARMAAQPNEPAEPVCMNDDGRESRVMLLGPEEVGLYYERLLQQPSPETMRNWGMRLGATQEEAEKFSSLVGNGIWDYLGALMAREDVLRLQPAVEDAVSVYARENAVAGGAAEYDAIEVHRHNDATTDPQVKSFVTKYWNSLGFHPQSYVPLAHYLRGYIETKCGKEKLHTDIHIVTDNPAGVAREIEELGARTKSGSTQISDCLDISFTISNPMSQERQGSCADRYGNHIAGLAGLRALRNARTLIAELHSGWSRLAWISRLTLNTERGEAYPALLKDTRVAWGFTHPGPPGL